MANKSNDNGNKNEQQFFAYCARRNEVIGQTGSGSKVKVLNTEWDAAKVVLRAQVGSDWHVGAPKGRAARMALFTAVQAEFDNPLIGQFSSLKVAKYKKNLGAHVKAEEKTDDTPAKTDDTPAKTVTTSKKTKATKVKMDQLKAMLADIQAQIVNLD
tara:strand:- start:107 stop:577 length:471 start_codon:yes stop_codon:yes gene_type:complete